MDLDVSVGEVAVPAPLKFCIIWLDASDWDRISFERQKQAYVFLERLYKDRCLFYCRGNKDIFNIISVKAPSVGEHTRVSEQTLRKVFDKYIAPKLKSTNFSNADVHVPQL
ncbi:MAG: hypothetical protein ACRC9L_08040 [Brevinema sp.]